MLSDISLLCSYLCVVPLPFSKPPLDSGSPVSILISLVFPLGGPLAMGESHGRSVLRVHRIFTAPAPSDLIAKAHTQPLLEWIKPSWFELLFSLNCCTFPVNTRWLLWGYPLLGNHRVTQRTTKLLPSVFSHIHVDKLLEVFSPYLLVFWEL